MKKIILATTSKWRIQAFEMLDLPFQAEGSNIDENFADRPKTPQELVTELAKRKAEAVAKNHKDGIIVGFDSIGWFQDKVLEKPSNKEEAAKRLTEMSGKEFQFYTGICLIDLGSNKKYQKVVTTKAFMGKLIYPEIEKYLNQDEYFTSYALGFDPLSHYSMSFIKKIEGSYNNLLRGIPIEKIVEMLKEVGIKI